MTSINWQPANLTQLIANYANRSPKHRFGIVGGAQVVSDVVATAAAFADELGRLGVRPGQRVALIGTNSDEYLSAWVALQFAGVESALINPTYPSDLLDNMLQQISPEVVLWVHVEADRNVISGAKHLIADQLSDGFITELTADGTTSEYRFESLRNGIEDFAVLPGWNRAPGDIAGYMHTSGTTGTPKFCTQTHEYFLRLGRFIADSMMLGAQDTVFAPLPLFHINPLGYGVIGSMVAGAQVVSATKFSASAFWNQVKSEHVTSMILHAPPIEILKRATTPEDATGHKVRSMFFADSDFLEDFQIPLGVSAYGSTESGGLSHVWIWRAGEQPDIPEGMSRYGGRARHDVDWKVTPDGEIWVKPKRDNVLFAGYQRTTGLSNELNDDGWFETGDIGRVDERGNLIFIERRAESIRVKGEYVPIGFVEDHFSKCPSISDVALWRSDSELVDHEVALYVVAPDFEISEVREAAQELPAFMRPAVVRVLAEIPRDEGVGKIRRRQLNEAHLLDEVLV